MFGDQLVGLHLLLQGFQSPVLFFSTACRELQRVAWLTHLEKYYSQKILILHSIFLEVLPFEPSISLKYLKKQTYFVHLYLISQHNFFSIKAIDNFDMNSYINNINKTILISIKGLVIIHVSTVRQQCVFEVDQI